MRPLYLVNHHWNRLVESLGHWLVKRVWGATWDMLRFKLELIRALPSAFKNIHLIAELWISMGQRAFGLVAISAVFTGSVAAYQMAYQFADIIPQIYVGMAVGKSVLVELGPILTGMIMVGQVGAAMCAELGHMAVNEQLDAMKCLNLNPNKYLLAPRLMASVLLLPVLNIVSSIVAILAAFGVAYACLYQTGFSWDSYINGIRLFYMDKDVYIGLGKSFVFGYILAFFACYFGSKAKNGAVGVGDAIQSSVVWAMTSILLANVIISRLAL